MSIMPFGIELDKIHLDIEFEFKINYKMSIMPFGIELDKIHLDIEFEFKINYNICVNKI